MDTAHCIAEVPIAWYTAEVPIALWYPHCGSVCHCIVVSAVWISAEVHNACNTAEVRVALWTPHCVDISAKVPIALH